MVASSIDVAAESSIRRGEQVNSKAYLNLHNGQVFADGMSFSGNERNKLWVNRGGSFADLSDLSGADIPNDSRAVLTADFDGDGDLDLFVHSIQRERHALFRNDAVQPGSPGAGFLALRLRATSGQWEGIGATVIVRAPAGPTAQVLSRGAGFVSCQAPELVFGLGDLDEAEVEVRWPGGARESFGRIASDSRALLVEGSGKPRLLAARPRPLPDPLPPGLRVSEGDLVPDLTVVDAAGTRRTLDVRALAGGKNVLLVFWASYCAPCVSEIPTLERIEREGKARVVAISVDVPSAVATAASILAREGTSYPGYFLDPKPPEESAAGEPRDVRALVDLERLSIPTTLVLSPEGRVESILRGPIEADR